MHTQKDPNLFSIHNSSQASLLSVQSDCSASGLPHRVSPVDSPSVYPPWTAAYTSAGPDQPISDRDYTLGSAGDIDASYYQTQSDSIRAVRRPPGTRSPLSANPSNPASRTTEEKAAAFYGSSSSISINTNLNGSSSIAIKSKQPEPLLAIPADQQKKRRRFFGFGEPKQTSSAAKPIGRTFSNRRQAPQTRIVIQTGPHAPIEQWPSGSTSATFSSPPAPGQLEGDSTNKSRQRHSVAVLSRHERSQSAGPSFLLAPEDSPVDEVASNRPSAWDRIRRPSQSRTPSQEQAYKGHNIGTEAVESKAPSPVQNPPSAHPQHRGDLPSRAHTASNRLQGGSMGPPSVPAHSNGRPEAAQQHLHVGNGQPGSYRGTPTGSPMVQNSEQGRNTPPPSKSSRDDLSSLDFPQLLARHEELNEKYRKVKKYYFDKDAQVQQLQNTLAHQRLSQSRTSLDDNEYATRFSRLDGAINNLAFNIRKDWRAVPPWLAPYVNRDAPVIVTKEMTAVGRACISRWLVDEIFDRYFHPALEPNFSSQLKAVEKNLRRYAPPTSTDEERDALLAKISNWRLATLDGLHDLLGHPDAAMNRSDMTKLLVDMLTTDLVANLKEPAPAGLEAGVIGIIELAVGIAANLPLESRDVRVEYTLPGGPVNEAFMKVEGTLPPLTNPGEGFGEPEGRRGSLDSLPEDREEAKDQGAKKKGMFGGLMGAGKTPPATRPAQAQAQTPPPPKEDRVRFAAFMNVEVKGRTMLIKAPVYI